MRSEPFSKRIAKGVSHHNQSVGSAQPKRLSVFPVNVSSALASRAYDSLGGDRDDPVGAAVAHAFSSPYNPASPRLDSP